jgi:hypothetical protein
MPRLAHAIPVPFAFLLLLFASTEAADSDSTSVRDTTVLPLPTLMVIAADSAHIDSGVVAPLPVLLEPDADSDGRHGRPAQSPDWDVVGGIIRSSELLRGWLQLLLTGAIAAGTLTAAFYAYRAYSAARETVKIEQGREEDREAEKRRARLVTTVEREGFFVSGKVSGFDTIRYEYQVRIRNHGAAEATDVNLTIHPSRGRDESVDVGCIGPAAYIDIDPPSDWRNEAVTAEITWTDQTSVRYTYRTTLYLGATKTGPIL